MISTSDSIAENEVQVFSAEIWQACRDVRLPLPELIELYSVLAFSRPILMPSTSDIDVLSRPKGLIYLQCKAA